MLPAHVGAGRSAPWRLAFLAVVPWLVSCTVQIQNRQPSQEWAEQARPAGSVYLGWRVFHDKCADCHGAAATGAKAPDLLPRVRVMGPRQFVGLVLTRYDWMRPPPPAGGEAVTPEEWVDPVTQRKAGAMLMPAWQGEPQVTAHIMDLYAYLSARAAGTQGPDRPAP
ncbi:MAG: c-type cytochrome [Rubrivivax sp.]|nr:c-type cytochrome [Rubrivivax sp.]